MGATRISAKGGSRIWYSEAEALLAAAYGGDAGLAEKLLRDEGAARRLPWGYLRKTGDAADDEFWGSAPRIVGNRAHVGVTFFVVGPGVGRDNGLRSTEYDGLWVSRAHVLALRSGIAAALLPEPTDGEGPAQAAMSASAQFAIAATRRLKTEGKIPATKAELGRLLEAEFKKAARAGQVRRALKAAYLEDQLAPWGIWPLK